MYPLEERNDAMNIKLDTVDEVYKALAAGWDFSVEHPGTRKKVSVQAWAAGVEIVFGSRYGEISTKRPDIVYRSVAEQMVKLWTIEERQECYQEWLLEKE